MVFDTLVSLGLNATSAILILSMVALGLVIIFGIMGVLNLAHGAFMTLGGYTIWLVATEFGLGFWAGLVAAPIAVGLVGLLVERLVIRWLYDRLIDTLLATWGLAIAIAEAMKLVFGQEDKHVANPLPGRIDVGVTEYPIYRLFLIVFAIAIIACVFLLFHRTKYGIRLRAVKQNDVAASIHGIDQDRIYAFSFALGSALTGLAGAALTPLIVVDPTMGRSYLIQAFLAVILGGAGSLLGVISGSTIVAGFANVASFYIQPVAAETLVFALVIVVIVLRSKIIRLGSRVRAAI
jgi:branched-chain amino acid transport system permease protein/urea transport system permease protein